MKTIWKNSFIFFAAALLLGASPAGNVPSASDGLDYRLSAERIAPGERLILELRLPARLAQAAGQAPEPAGTDPSDDRYLPVVHDDLLLQLPQIQILDKDYRREKDTLIWRYELTSYQLGKLFLPPLEVRLGPRTYSTEGKEIEVTTTRPAGDDGLREEYGAVRPPIHWGRLLKGLLLLLFAGLLWFLWRRYADRFLRRPVPSPPAIVAPEEIPLEWLRRQLATLRSRLGNRQGEGSIVDDLTGTLREYYARRDHQPVQAWTTREFRHHFHADHQASALTSVFERCDEFKFTGASPLSPLEVAHLSLQESERILLACGI